MIRIHPTGHRVLVQLKQVEEVTAGGIYLPGKHAERETKAMQEALVIEIGQSAFKGFDDGHPWCAVGDTVMIAKYSGEDRKDEATGHILRIINDEDIFARLEQESEDGKGR